MPTDDRWSDPNPDPIADIKRGIADLKKLPAWRAPQPSPLMVRMFIASQSRDPELRRQVNKELMVDPDRLRDACIARYVARPRTEIEWRFLFFISPWNHSEVAGYPVRFR